MTRAPEHRLRAQGAAHAEGRGAPPRRRGRGAARARRAARPQAGAPLRRPAAARRDGPRDRARAEGVPHGRAALEPRREAPRRHARLARAAARPARRDDRLRDPRPDRGDDARPARRGHARRPHPPGRHAAAALPRARRPVRGRLHRHARDEPRRGAVAGGETAFGGYRVPLDPAGGRPRASSGSCSASGPRRSRRRASRAPGCRRSTRRRPCVEELGADAHVFFHVDAARPAGGDRPRDSTLLADERHALHARASTRAPGPRRRRRAARGRPGALPLLRPGDGAKLLRRRPPSGRRLAHPARARRPSGCRRDEAERDEGPGARPDRAARRRRRDPVRAAAERRSRRLAADRPGGPRRPRPRGVPRPPPRLRHVRRASRRSRRS